MDEIRGFAVFCMLCYHMLYLLAFLFSSDWAYSLFLFFSPAQPYFAGLFILICGVSSQLSHSNWKRGIQLFSIAIIITFVTIVYIPEQKILFGILHLLSICILIFACVHSLFCRVPALLGMALCLLCFCFTFFIERGFLQVPFLFSISLPRSLYMMDFMYPLGIYNREFYFSDYFPLFPWCFIFFFGTFLGRFAKEQRFPKFMYQPHIGFLSWLGNHALWVYILHQPIFYCIILLLQIFIKF